MGKEEREEYEGKLTCVHYQTPVVNVDIMYYKHALMKIKTKKKGKEWKQTKLKGRCFELILGIEAALVAQLKMFMNVRVSGLLQKVVRTIGLFCLQ